MGVIEREALVKWLKDAGWHLCTLDGAKAERKVLGKIIDHVEAMPTVDAVEVVRCKDCKHYDVSAMRCIPSEDLRDYTDFCSYGERRGE